MGVSMIENKKEKLNVLQQILKSLEDRVVKHDLDPLVEGKKTKMVIKAEGDSPEDVKEEVIKKLQGMSLPESEDVEDEMIEDEDEDYLADMPEALKEAIKKKLKK
jgi:hypothetical protein